MPGVDLCDMLLETYCVRQCMLSIIAYFYYCIGMSVNNSWLLYHLHMNQQHVPIKNQLSLLQFRTQIGDSLCKAGKNVLLAKCRCLSLTTEKKVTRKRCLPNIENPS